MEALRTVPALDPTPSPPATPMPGQCWVDWTRTEFSTRAGACVIDRTTWQVVAILPAQPDPARVDALRDDVADALAAHGIVVESAEPIGLVIEPAPANPVPAIRWTASTRT